MEVFKKSNLIVRMSTGAFGCAETNSNGTLPQVYCYKMCLTPESSKSDFMFLKLCIPRVQLPFHQRELLLLLSLGNFHHHGGVQKVQLKCSDVHRRVRMHGDEQQWCAPAGLLLQDVSHTRVIQSDFMFLKPCSPVLSVQQNNAKSTDYLTSGWSALDRNELSINRASTPNELKYSNKDWTWTKNQRNSAYKRYSSGNMEGTLSSQQTYADADGFSCSVAPQYWTWETI
ncbi:hypothetical protein INR49_024737 [Caranx melampygus]|nr:hypothetical protein INR49_024737 [Caranx melampygus]